MHESLKLNVRAHWGSHGPHGLQRLCVPPFHLGRAEGAGGFYCRPSSARPFLLTPVWMAWGRDTQCSGVRQVLMRKTLEVSPITTHALLWVLLDAALGQSCKSQFTEINVN